MVLISFSLDDVIIAQVRAFVKPFLNFFENLVEVALGAGAGAAVGVVEAGVLVAATNSLEIVTHGRYLLS